MNAPGIELIPVLARGVPLMRWALTYWARLSGRECLAAWRALRLGSDVRAVEVALELWTRFPAVFDAPPDARTIDRVVGDILDVLWIHHTAVGKTYSDATLGCAQACVRHRDGLGVGRRSSYGRVAMHYDDARKAAEKAAVREAEDARRRLMDAEFDERSMKLENDLGYSHTRGVQWMSGVIDRLVKPQTEADHLVLREYVALTRADRYGDGGSLIHRMHEGLLERLKMAAAVGSLETINAVLTPLVAAPRRGFLEALRLVLSRKELQRKSRAAAAGLLQGVARQLKAKGVRR
jgi:hypothetical protein